MGEECIWHCEVDGELLFWDDNLKPIDNPFKAYEVFEGKEAGEHFLSDNVMDKLKQNYSEEERG